MQDEDQLIVLCSESKYREVSSNWSSLELTHSAPTGRPGTLLPSRGPTKYLINGRNCDTISNEPFIEPHLDNPEIGSRVSRVPNQRIPPQCRRRSFPPTATSTHLSFVKRSQVVTRMIRRQAGGLQPGGSSTTSAPSAPWDALSSSPRNTSTKPPTSYTSENSSGNLHFTIL